MSKDRKHWPPIVYAGLDEDKAVRQVAPELLRKAGRGKCHRCGKAVVFEAGHFGAFRDMARRLARRFQLLCNRCADRELEEPGDTLVSVLPMAAEDQRAQRRFELQRN